MCVFLQRKSLVVCMDLNSTDSSDNEEPPPKKKGENGCVILSVYQPPKRRKRPLLGMPKKKKKRPAAARPDPVPDPVPVPDVVEGSGVRRDTDGLDDSDNAASDTESEHDDEGKEARLQRRAVERNRRCISDKAERDAFDRLSWERRVFFKPKRARKTTNPFNIACNRGSRTNPMPPSYDDKHVDDQEVEIGLREVWPRGSPRSTSSWHDSDSDHHPGGVEDAELPPKKRKQAPPAAPAAPAPPAAKRRTAVGDLSLIHI